MLDVFRGHAAATRVCHTASCSHRHGYLVDRDPIRLSAHRRYRTHLALVSSGNGPRRSDATDNSIGSTRRRWRFASFRVVLPGQQFRGVGAMGHVFEIMERSHRLLHRRVAFFRNNLGVGGDIECVDLCRRAICYAMDRSPHSSARLCWHSSG